MVRVRFGVVPAVLCGLLFTAGCVQEKPIVSMPGGTNSMTLEEQREWVAKQLDAAVAASEVPDGWYDTYWRDVYWAQNRPEDREMLMEAWFPNSCGDNAGRLDMSLKNMENADPLAATARVRAFWESEGYPVRDLYATHNDTEPYFIVDFEDGGTFSMQAGATGMTMSVHTACAAGAMVIPRDLSEDDTGNPFEEELQRRSDGAEAAD